MPVLMFCFLIIILCFQNLYLWNGFGASVIAFSSVMDSFTVHVDSDSQSDDMRHFWRSTGFCPPDPHQKSFKFDLSGDMKHNLAYIGSVPHSGMQQVRIHWLLDLVTVIRWNGSYPIYNFSKLDSLIDLLYANGLQPGFEVMGNPSGIFSDFDNKTQVHLWKHLITEVANNYINIYGLGTVMSWNFETWNEPDCRDFDKVRMTVQGFLNYYDATSEGLIAADPTLRFGGPADGCVHRAYAEALYKHVVSGINYFTGKKDVRIDFISLHMKGHGSSRVILLEETVAWKHIVKNYPSLSHKPFYNDEADPLVGWSKNEIWRSDSTYAAMVVKIITQHQNLIIANSKQPIQNYTLLSNDNGFLSYHPHEFTQRTLLARFQMNTTVPPHVQFIRKPVYTVMGFLSKLGERQLQVEISDTSGKQVKNDSHFGVLATVHLTDGSSDADSWQVAILIYNSNDTKCLKQNAEVTLNLIMNPPNSTEMMIASYTVNQADVNPFAIWLSQGKPNYPSRKQFEEMRKHENPHLFDLHPVKPGHITLSNLSMVESAVTLLHICAKPNGQPDQVPDINISNITTGQVLITWSDKCVHSKCLLRYEVEFSSKSSSGPYKRINDEDSYFPVFVYSPFHEEPPSDSYVRGYYRVRAVDYWKRAGEFSLPQMYPDDSK